MNPLPSLLLLAFISILLVAPADAQPYGTDLIVSDYSGNLFRVSPKGAISTIGNYGQLWSIKMDPDNKHIIGAVSTGRTTGHLVRIDHSTGLITTTIPTGWLFLVEVDQDGDYLVSQRDAAGIQVVKVKHDGSGMSTIVPGFSSVPAFTRDRTSGDWILGVGANQLLRYPHDWSGVKTTVTHNSVYTYELTKDPHLPHIYLGALQLARFDPASNTVTTLTGNIATNLGDRGLVTDRSPGAGGAMIYMSSASSTASSIQRFDRTGVNLGVFASFSTWVTGIVFDKSKNLASVIKTPPNDRYLRISFPADAGKPYTLALSLSGCTPGVKLPGGLVIPLVLDNLTILTTRQPLPPLLVNNLGILNASGEAVATLSLNPLGSVITGVRLWAAVVVIDPNAPLGISQISEPVLIIL